MLDKTPNDRERRYTMAEIMAAFDDLARDLDSNLGDGTSGYERLLLADVHNDVRNFLENIAPVAMEVRYAD